MIRYSGDTNYALSLKYRALTNTSQGAAHLLNLIWTDLTAFTVVGTKHGFELDHSPSSRLNGRSVRGETQTSLGQRSVHVHRRVVKYSNLWYAVPAIIVAVIWTSLFVLVIALCLGSRIQWRSLHNLTNQTSMGRVATNRMNFDKYEPSAKTVVWLDHVGNEPLDVPTASPRTPRQRDRSGFWRRKFLRQTSTEKLPDLIPGDHVSYADGSTDVELSEAAAKHETTVRHHDSGHFDEQVPFDEHQHLSPDSLPANPPSRPLLAEPIYSGTTLHSGTTRFSSLHSAVTTDRPRTDETVASDTQHRQSLNIPWDSRGGHEEGSETLLRR